MKLKDLFNVFEAADEKALDESDAVGTDVVPEVEKELESAPEEIILPQGDAEQVEDKVYKDEKVEAARLDYDIAINLLRNDLRFHASEMLNAVMELKYEIKEKSVLLDKQEETIRRQSQTISKFQDDLLYKVQKPLIMEMVEIADNIRLILNDKEILENKDFEALLDRVKKLSDWVDASLSNNSVRRYSLTTESPATLDRKKQEVIDVEFTDDPSKDSTYFTERPGYIWTMPYLIINSDIQLKKALEDAPKSFEFIIRPEEVVKYKYQKSEEN